MYEAKNERANHIYLVRVRIENGELAIITDREMGPPRAVSGE